MQTQSSYYSLASELDRIEAAAANSPYYFGYKQGYRAGEVDGELGSGESLGNVGLPASGEVGLNIDAYHEAVLWGYRDGLEGNKMRSAWSVEAYLDSNFSI